MYMVHVYYFTANGVLPFLLHEMFKVLRICAFSNYYIRVGTSAAIWSHLVTDTRTYYYLNSIIGNFNGAQKL